MPKTVKLTLSMHFVIRQIKIVHCIREVVGTCQDLFLRVDKEENTF